jgi:hypothetical protein
MGKILWAVSGKCHLQVCPDKRAFSLKDKVSKVGFDRIDPVYFLILLVFISLDFRKFIGLFTDFLPVGSWERQARPRLGSAPGPVFQKRG